MFFCISSCFLSPFKHDSNRLATFFGQNGVVDLSVLQGGFYGGVT